MAHISESKVDGVVYTYDSESRNPLGLDAKMRMWAGTLVYDKNTRAPTRILKGDIPAPTPVVTVAKPTISITSDGKVTITCATAGAVIYYTTNGSNPSDSSTEYAGQFTLADSATVKAIAYAEIDGEEKVSGVASKAYTKQSTPTPPPSNNFTVYYGFAAKTGLDGDEELEDWVPLVSASDVTNTDEVTAVEKSSILGEYHIVANNAPGFTRMGIFAYPATLGSFKDNYNIADKSFPTNYLPVEEKTVTINGTNYIIVIGVATNMAASGNDVIITRK